MIDILLALYNGEKFLSEQIDSILSQSFTDWRLIICDDGSTDNSYEIAARYANKYPEKIKVYKNSVPSGSAQANFMGMLKYAESDYIMFSDQDDVWLPEKVEVTLEKMKQLESIDNVPVLVHSELLIADIKMNILKNSFTHYQGLNPKHKSLNRLMVQNNVTGCTVMINKSLKELVKNVPAEKMLMHDWWFALTAAAFGKIGFIEKPLIKYRQHGGNQLGAVNNRNVTGILRIVGRYQSTRNRINVTYKQADNFYNTYCGILGEECEKCIEKYTSVPKNCKLKRVWLLSKNKYLKQNFVSIIGQLIFC